MIEINAGFIGCFGVQYRCIFLRVLQYFDEPAIYYTTAFKKGIL